jgi:hypothetical protein
MDGNKMKHTILIIIFLLSSPLFADRGVIAQKDVNLAEPAQRAIIMHNGTWELLILQTDVHADSQVRALEFMPLPSKPEVSVAPEECFKNLQLLIDKHRIKYVIQQSRKTQDGSAQQLGVKVVSKHDLGPHQVTVVEINDVNTFQSWVTDFFAENFHGKPIITNDLRNIVADYFSRGFKYFAFDVIDMPLSRKTVAPLTYRFKCDHVYYPLKVTNLYGGNGTVEIFYAINPWLDPNAHSVWPYFNSYKGQEITGRNWIYSWVFRLPTEDLSKLHPAAKELFLSAGSPFFAAKYEGKLLFKNDIWQSVGYGSPEFRFLSLLQKGEIENLEFLVDAPFGLNREVLKDKKTLFAAFKRMSQDPNLIQFKIKSIGSFSGIWRNEFDKMFIDSYLKNEHNLYEYVYESDSMSAYFFVTHRNDETARVVYFRLGKLYDY